MHPSVAGARPSSVGVAASPRGARPRWPWVVLLGSLLGGGSLAPVTSSGCAGTERRDGVAPPVAPPGSPAAAPGSAGSPLLPPATGTPPVAGPGLGSGDQPPIPPATPAAQAQPLPPVLCPPPPAPEPFPYFSAAEAGHSVSVGTVSEGHLVNAAPLPQPCPACRVLPRQATRCLTYGSEELVALLLRAAARVEREYPGSVLSLGDLAAVHGGDIVWSVSHNSGRDADLGFYISDPEGRPVAPGDLLLFDRHGWCFDAQGAYRIDLDRTWALVRALLEDPQTPVQFLFLYRPLTELLLAHARRHGASPTLLAQAAARLLEPVGAPHNDHVHLRIHCSGRDLQLGCRELGPRRDGAPEPEPLVRQRVAELLPRLRAKDGQRRFDAVWLLGLLGEASAVPGVTARLRDEQAAVRHRALQTLVELQASAATPAIAELLQREGDPAVLLAAVGALATLGGRSAERGLARLLADPREFTPDELGDYRTGCPAPRASADPAPSSGLPAGLVPASGEVQPLTIAQVPAGPESGGPTLAGVLRAAAAPFVAPLQSWLGSGKILLRREVARSLALATDPQVVPPLLARLADPDPGVVEAAHYALCRIANRDEGRRPDAWQRWWTTNRKKSRLRWVAEGFRQAGFAVADRPSRRDVPHLLAAVRVDGPISFNARRVLQTLLGPAPRAMLDWSVADARLYWARRWRRAGGR